MGRSTIETVDVRADGMGLSSRAGTALLALTAQRLGLTDGLSGGLAGTRERCSSHDPGRVLWVLLSIGQAEIDRVRRARALARGARCIRRRRIANLADSDEHQRQRWSGRCPNDSRLWVQA
jgi:hypothetical protein